MRYPLEAALRRYAQGNLPAWGEAEAEIDPPSWAVAETGSAPALPGTGSPLP